MNKHMAPAHETDNTNWQEPIRMPALFVACAFLPDGGTWEVPQIDSWKKERKEGRGGEVEGREEGMRDLFQPAEQMEMLTSVISKIGTFFFF